MHPAARVSIAALVLWVGFLTVASARAQDPDADFAGFRIPDHDLRTLTATVEGAFWPRRGITPTWSHRDQDLDGRLGASGSWWRDSDTVQRKLTFETSLAGAKRWSRDERPGSYGYRDESRRREVSERWYLSGQIMRYQESNPLAVGFFATLAGDYGQLWANSRTDRTSTADTSVTHEERDGWSRSATHTSSMSVTVGVGRVRDARIGFGLTYLFMRDFATPDWSGEIR